MSKTQANTSQATDPDLVDLQPDSQSLVTRILAPKFIILAFLSLIFISKNIYNLYFYQGNSPVDPNSPGYKPPKQPAESDSHLWNRLYGFAALTIVLLVLYILLVRYNDNAILRKIKEEENNKNEENKKKTQEVSENSDEGFVEKDDCSQIQRNKEE